MFCKIDAVQVTRIIDLRESKESILLLNSEIRPLIYMPKNIFTIRSIVMASFESKRRIVLVLFGCFNPVTFQHLRLFEIARDFLQKFGEMKVVRGIISPVHDTYPKKGLIPSQHRVAMLRLALENSDWIHLDEWETKQQSWTLTNKALSNYQKEIDEEFKNDLPAPRVMMICGADLLQSFSIEGLWADKDVENILKSHGIVVISRDDIDIDKVINEVDLLYASSNRIFIVKEWVRHDLSSTKVRRCVKRGQSIKYLVPDKVIDHIIQNKLYS